MKATSIMFGYADTLGFDGFVFPVEKGNCLSIALVSLNRVGELIEKINFPGNVKTIEVRNHEEYARLRRIYSANKVLSEWRPNKVIDTPYKNLKSIPAFRSTLARSFEVVAANALTEYYKMCGFIVKHTGDNISEPDITIYDREGNFIESLEVKCGAGKFDCANNEEV